MLVLAIKRGETVLIGDNIRITAVDAGPAVNRIGIDAPADVDILRGEVAARILANGGDTVGTVAEPVTD